MRDPLQTEPALDELLELPPHATKQDVNAAFARAIARPRGKADVARLTEARKKLGDPVERALLAALRYDDRWLLEMDPCPLQEPDCLLLTRRTETARRWESEARQRFGDLAVTHCLAVAWYWTAVAAARTENVEGAGLADLWSGAIAYWAAVVNDTRFAQALLDSEPERAQALSARLVDLLRGQIHAALVAAPSAPGLAALDAQLTTEMRSARICATIPGVAVPTAAGVLLLQRLGRAQAIRELLERSGRDDDDTRWLAGMLSPLGRIVAMLDARRFDDALVALEALSGEERTGPAASALFLRAYTMRAKHQLELGKVAEAVESYELALGHATRESKQSIRQAVKAAATGLAAKRSGGARASDETIAVLERAHRIVADDQLRDLLSDRLVERGVGRFRDGQDRLEKSDKGATEAIKRRLRSGIQDLKRARDLGSARAVEQLEVAERFYAAVVSGWTDREPGRGPISANAADHMDRAQQAAQREDWDEALRHLRLAAKAMGAQPHDEVTKAIAVVLVNRAMAKANAAIDQANKAVAGARPGSPPVTELFFALSALNQALTDLLDAKKEDPGLQGVDQHIAHVRRNREAITSALGVPGDFGLPAGAGAGRGSGKSKTGGRRLQPARVLRWAVGLAVAAVVLYGLNTLYVTSSTWKSVIEGAFVVLWLLFLVASSFKR